MGPANEDKQSYTHGNLKDKNCMGYIRALLRIVIPFFDLYLLRIVQHRTWKFPFTRRLPLQRLAFTSIKDVDVGDVSLCERLIAAYVSAEGELSSSVSASKRIWAPIILNKYGELLSPLNERDAGKLARVLRVMFRQKFLYGISSANLYRRSLSWRIWSLKILDDLASLSEYLGVTRMECPGQGDRWIAFEEGLDDLIARIESAIGFKIGFPEIGGSYGIYVGRSFLTMESIEHLYVAEKFRKWISRLVDSSQLSIMEIGAGFGGTAYWLLQMLGSKVESYTIIDLPVVNVLQGYFLAKAISPDKITLYGETQRNALVRIYPTHAIERCEPVEVLFNENSMPEIPEQSVTKYLTWAKSNLRSFFFSYNQEADANQVLVSRVIAQVGGFERLDRSCSWLRTGYVEEVYAPMGRLRWSART